MAMEIQFDRKCRIISIDAEGVIDLRDLYTKICDWLYMPENMVEPELVLSFGRIPVVGGRNTVPVIVFINGWLISAKKPLTITGGYLDALDANGKPINPVHPGAANLIRIL